MSNNDSMGAGLAIGCGILAVMLVGVGFLFFGRVSAVSAVPGSGTIELGYTLAGGDWRSLEDNVFEGTVHIRPTPDWSIREFELGSSALRIDGTDYPMTLTSPLPKLPATRDFDLRFEVELPKAAEGEAQLGASGTLSFELRTFAKTGLFGGKCEADGSRGLKISGNRLVAPTP